MKREATSCIIICVLATLYACKDDSSDGKSGGAPPPAQDTTGTEAQPGDDKAGVDCSHPGAGKPLGDNRCECATTRNIAGEWSTMRTCREGNACTTRDKAETIVITQDGTKVKADRGDAYSVTGTLCGDVVVWSGGATDGLNVECGTFRFSDDGHYVADWCFAAGGDCKPTSGEGCPAMKGQCTGTAARSPDAAPKIQKLLCD
jgi:hypothetical protein